MSSESVMGVVVAILFGCLVYVIREMHRYDDRIVLIMKAQKETYEMIFELMKKSKRPD
jgi:hypothetical protein